MSAGSGVEMFSCNRKQKKPPLVLKRFSTYTARSRNGVSPWTRHARFEQDETLATRLKVSRNSFSVAAGYDNTARMQSRRNRIVIRGHYVLPSSAAVLAKIAFQISNTMFKQFSSLPNQSLYNRCVATSNHKIHSYFWKKKMQMYFLRSFESLCNYKLK